jgi:hypothetical protein
MWSATLPLAYGDFNTAVADVAADEMAGGMIAEPRGGDDEARLAW